MSLDHLITEVVGVHPLSGEQCQSSLYSKICDDTVDEIFQTDLSHKFGEGIKGAKAVIYYDELEGYKVAFLTEAVITHHRHAAATIAGLEDQRAQALYHGDYSKIHDLLDRVAGFEIQYDTQNKKIVGIQQDSWITKRQMNYDRVLRKDMQEEMLLELLSCIDPKYLSEQYRELDCLDDEKLLRDSIC